MSAHGDEHKLRELILYVARRCEEDPHFGSTKLNKILFYSDFVTYGATARPITGVEYQKLQHGPAPRRLKPILDAMAEAGECAIQYREHFGYVQRRPVALRDPDLRAFSGEEINRVEQVLRNLWGHTASEVSDLSHHLHGWEVAELGETIPYQAVFLGQRSLWPAEIRYGQQLATELGV